MIYYIFLLIVAFVCFLCIRSTYRSYVAKKTRQFWTKVIVFGGILFYVLFANELIPGSKTYYDYRYTKSLLGKAIKLDNVFTYESYREPLLGDGYSMYVYGIDDETAEYFRNPKKAFFSDFPVNSSYNTNWLRKKWSKCPIEESDTPFRKFALSEYDYHSQHPPTKLENVQRLIHVMLNEKGNYYAYSAMLHNESVWNISFYLLSPKNNLLIVVYSKM